MSGLDSLLTTSKTSTTAMPAWYDQAQQNVVNQATAGAAAMPSLQNTVAGQAINNLSGPTNPFAQAQSNLSQLATSNANPWITSPTGQVTPNTATPLGGLFAAQNQQLQQLIPQYTAQPNAQSISGGQFGSLRNATAADTAIANAQAQMLPGQYQAALDAQKTAIGANTALGNVGSQGTATETALGQLQQANPMQSTANLAQILNTIKAPESTQVTTQLPLASQIGGIKDLIGAGGDILKNLGIGSGSGGILNVIGGLLGGGGGGSGSDPYGNLPIYTGADSSYGGGGSDPYFNGSDPGMTI
jgi:hypothetical protein